MITRYEKIICKVITLEMAAMRAKNPAFKEVWLDKAIALEQSANSLTVEQAQEMVE